MKPEDIHITDWVRIFVGGVPAVFYLELLIRAAVVYLVLMMSMRFMGKRMSGLLSRNEIVAMISLAAAIGIPLTSPDWGLLPAVIIAVVVVFIENWVSAKASTNRDFEKFALGNIDILISDSVIDLQTMKKVRISRERLVSELRSSGIKHLGSVKRFYLEAGGFFTLIENTDPVEGLSILPRWDKDFNDRFVRSDNIMVCEECGTIKNKPFDPETKCPHCGNMSWTAAVK